MSIFRSQKEKNIEQAIDKKALLFGLMCVFLCGIGFSIITPVVPFLVQPYTSSPGEQAIAVTLLTSVYAVCVFCGSRTWSFERQIWPASIALNMSIGFCHRVLRVWFRRSSMDTICWSHHRRHNRREHKHDLRLFC